MVTRIETDNPQTRALLDRAMTAGGYSEVGELLDDMLTDRLLEQDRVKQVLAVKLQEGLASESLPLDDQVIDEIEQRLCAIADKARKSKRAG